ncbi:MAG: stage II sporulation protein M [Alphaproteobacteria bacterium]|nr:stage II sporulation protein M [Alphaproteobacteria bacterium]
MDRLDTTTLVDTPERIRFRHRIAGPGQRAAAFTIDVVLQLLLLAAMSVIAEALSVFAATSGLGQGQFLLGMFAVQWLYGVFFEFVLAGRTPGKLAMDLRVVRVDGSPARFPDLLLRNLVRAADFLPFGFGVGVACMTVDPRMRRLGDLVAGTMVIAEDRSRSLLGVRIEPPVSEDERLALPAKVDLRAAEVEAIEGLLSRRRELGSDRTEELARSLAPVLSERTGVEAATAERVLQLVYARATGKDRPDGVPADDAGLVRGVWRDAFVAAGRSRWTRLETLLAKHPDGPREWSELAAGYRAAHADLATARSRGLPPDVQAFLDELAARAHTLLYGLRRTGGTRILDDALHGFPAELRRQWPFFLGALVLFYGPLLIGFVGSWLDPGFAARILSEDQLASVEEMYSGDLARSSGADMQMAGFYVFNNVGIAFRCFATGILAGAGPLFYLIYNGLTIGTVGGYLTGVGLGGNLLAFVVGHSAWELTGVCVAGAGGLRMGWALIATGGRSRIGSLSAAGPILYRLVLGAATMLLVAAAIEGFWSAGPVPMTGKLVFGFAQLVVVLSWLTFGGRRRRVAP